MIYVNGDAYEADSSTIEAVLVELSLPTRGVAVALDGAIVPRSQWGATTLHDGARVEVVTAAAGG